MRYDSAKIILGIALLLCGCEVGPDYHAPQISIEKSFGPATREASSEPSALTTGSLADAHWWQNLNDPVLDSLMERTVGSNLDVKIAQARVREARAEFAYATGGQYPNANFDAGYSHNQLSKTAAPYNAFNVPGFPWEYNQYQIGFDAAWEVDIFGGVRRGAEAADADLSAAVADDQGVLLSAMAEVARNYIDLRGYQNRYAIALNNLKSQRQTLEVTRDRQRRGVVSELDVAQAQSQVAKTEARLPLFQRAQSEAIHRIAVLLGEQPEGLTGELSAPRPVPVPPPEIAIGVPAELLRRRPDIRRAERQLAAATARVGQTKADLYPKFSLTGNFAMLSADTNELFDWRSRSYGIGPTLTWPIFDAGRIRSLVDIRNAQQEESLATYDRTVLGALEEVHNAIVTFATEQERNHALIDAVNADQTAMDIAQEQYRQGVIDFLNVQDAQRSLLDSQDQLADSDQSVMTSLVALYKALGGGWELSASPATHPSTEDRATAGIP